MLEELGAAAYPAGIVRNRWAIVLAMVALASIVTMNRLGHDICRGNEAIEAVLLQQMVEHGQMFPLENGQSPMYMPPLFHWTALAIHKLLDLHTVTPASFRLTSALYATGSVALVSGFSYGILGPDGAILAGLTLLGEHEFVRLGRLGRVDTTLAFYETLALLAFLWWLRAFPEEGQTRRVGAARLYFLGIVLGLAVLAKGPIGAGLPGLAMVIFLLVERRFIQALRQLRPLPVLLSLAVATSWYGACYLAGKQNFLHRLFDENMGHLMGWGWASMPPWFYLAPTLLSSLPLSLLVPIAVFFALFRNPPPPPYSTDDRLVAVQRRDASRLLAIYWLVALLFLSAAVYKSRWYMQPIWPASAIVLAWGVKRFAAYCKARYGFRRLETAYAAIALLAVLTNLFMIPLEERHECAKMSYRQTAQAILGVVKPGEPLYAAGFVDEDAAPLLFYLHRTAPFIPANLDGAPGGYIIIPARLWSPQRGTLAGFRVLLRSPHGRRQPVLLYHVASAPPAVSGGTAGGTPSRRAAPL
ncbi:MAG TPA: phospholipid carrier-dependent glycosyltransferase [Candidatus Binataceae bacterium]|nr:phospholipid carrier-dependent glycosyltransferase [Candidatus Binataceae bacterium]